MVDDGPFFDDAFFSGIDWSSQPSWNLTPAARIDASLLAVGDRAGCVTFLRYARPPLLSISRPPITPV